MIKRILSRVRSGVRNVHFQAATSFVPLASVPNSTDSKLGQLYSTSADLSTFVNGFFKFAIALGAIAAVLRIAYAGYLYMGTDMWGNKSKAKSILTDVVVGLLLLLSIWIILHQINPQILELRALQTLKNAATQSSQSTQQILPPGTP